jgi:hypothetical protein
VRTVVGRGSIVLYLRPRLRIPDEALVLTAYGDGLLDLRLNRIARPDIDVNAVPYSSTLKVGFWTRKAKGNDHG